jgi:hypothetical protein
MGTPSNGEGDSFSEEATSATGAPSSPTLSPNAAPFFLGGTERGRSKQLRWADAYGDELDDDHPASYLDVARRPTKPVATPPLRS